MVTNDWCEVLVAQHSLDARRCQPEESAPLCPVGGSCGGGSLGLGVGAADVSTPAPPAVKIELA